ncbi:reverse transcriptase domain-containing protein [Tanacetum coccineum]
MTEAMVQEEESEGLCNLYVSVPTPDFMKCQPLNFKGTKGVVGLSQWLKKMELVFHISSCAVENQVKFATCTLLGTFKKKLTNKYCTNGEIKKLEIELWNLKVRGNDVAAYTQRFQELALMCTKFLADETAKINKDIGGLPDNIHGNVMSARPKTLDFAFELANDLMDQKLRTYAERQNENKRKADDSSRNHHQQQPHKKENVARAYTAGPGEKKIYTRDLPLCTKCNYQHTGQCAPKCGKCKRQVSDEELEAPMKDQPLFADASPTALSPGYIADFDPEEDEEDPKENPADYPADGGDNDDNESSNDDDDDDDVEKDEEDEEEEEYLALLYLMMTPLLYLQMILSPQAEDTEAVKTDESASTPPTPYHFACIIEFAAALPSSSLPPLVSPPPENIKSLKDNIRG